jgi:hypothetical protein
MQFHQSTDTLLKAYSDSVSTLLEEIVTMSRKVDATDPDPERTKTHHLDRMLRKWFRSGGGLGY